MFESPPLFTSNLKAQSEIDWLIPLLPSPHLNPHPRGFEAASYGASTTIARELGLPLAPESLCGWTHHWYHQPLHDPRDLLVWEKPQYSVLVCNPQQADFLQRKGYPYAVATGLPFIYQRPLGLPRREGSLLVMPPHATEHIAHNVDPKAWIEYLLTLRKRFKTVVACVFRSCIGRFWTPALDEVGIPWVCGAHSLDMNSLLRMRTLFESFEYVNSSVIGSQVAYAAYAGARPSISGPELHLSDEAFKGDPFYEENPHLLISNQKAYSREYAQKMFPFLCKEPDQISDLSSWGAEMLGESSKRPYEEIARLLGWRFDPSEAAYSGADFDKIASKLGWGDSHERMLEQAKQEALYEIKSEVIRNQGETQELLRQNDTKLTEVHKLLQQYDTRLADISRTLSDASAIIDAKLEYISRLINVEVRMPSAFEIFTQSLKSSDALKKIKEKKLTEDILYLQNSPLFDATWYLAQSPDAAQSGADAATHFIRIGEEAGRPASPFFKPEEHLQKSRRYRNLPFTGSYYVQYLRLLERKTALQKSN